MADIKINGVTYPAKKRAVLPGVNGEPQVFELPVDPDPELNGYSKNAVQNKVVHAAIQDVRQRQTSPYNFKGSVATLADLPSTGQEVNDTYYVEALKYQVTWTGSAWQQSSMSEVEYMPELQAMTETLTLNGGAAPIDDWVEGYKIVNAGSALGDPAADAKWRYCRIPCAPGDRFVINVNTGGYTAYRAWAFFDTAGKLIRHEENADEVNAVIVAPTGAVAMVSNDYSASSTWTRTSYRNVSLGSRTRSNTDAIKAVLDEAVDFGLFRSKTSGGVTFAVDRDKRTVTVTGTATANVILYVAQSITGASEITYGGCPAGGGNATYNLALHEISTKTRVSWNGGETEFTTYQADPTKEYALYISVFSGTALPASGLVFRPTALVGGRLPALEALVERYHANCIYSPLSGVAFAAHCGDTLFLDCVAFRLIDRESKSYTAEVNDTVALELATEVIRYVCFDGTEFAVRPQFDTSCIAVVYKHQVQPLVGNLIADYRRIQDGYIRPGGEYYLNFARMPFDALLGYSGPDVKISERGYILKSAGQRYYETHGTDVPFALRENQTDISGKKVLMIGDSFVARGYIQHFLQTLVPSLQFIGTRTTQNYDIPCEGVSGSRMYYFTDPDSSPFWFDGALNFTKYLAANHLSAPDYVVINSAINHTAYNNDQWGSYLSTVTALVDMVHDYDPNIKVYLTYGANYATAPASSYGYPVHRYREVRKCCNAVYGVDGVTVIPVDPALIDELDYAWAAMDYFGQTVRYLSDCVHPTEAAGFRKIANMIYNYLGV